MAITAKLRSNNGPRAKTVLVGQAMRLTELTDIDPTNLTEGAVLVYDATTQKFKVTAELDNDSTIISGGKY